LILLVLDYQQIQAIAVILLDQVLLKFQLDQVLQMHQLVQCHPQNLLVLVLHLILERH
jgi:hypothetical protein